MIRKFLTAAVATAVIGAAALTAPVTPAEARGGIGVGAGIAAGVVGGAIIGGAIANSQPRTYVETPVYEDNTVTCQRVLVRDEDGNRYWRRVCN